MPSDPSSLSGKLLWLRAKDNAGAGGAEIATWADKSGLGRDGTAVLYPTVDTTNTTPAGGRTVRTSNGFFNLPDLMLTGIRSNVPGVDTEAVVALFDGNTSTKWFAPSATVWVDFGVAAPLAATTYSLTSANDSPGRDPKDWTLYGSNDRSAWTAIDSRAGESFASRALTKTYAITGAATYRYFKLDVTANNGTAGQFQLAELTIGNASGNATVPRPSVEVWLVVKADSSTSSNGGWTFGAGTPGNEVRYSDSGVVRDGVNLKSNATRRAFTPTLPITAWRLYRVQTTPTTYQAWLDNTSQVSGAVTTGEWGYTGTCRIGSGAGSNIVLFVGNIAETLVVDHALTPTEAADLITYFNTEHGLSVPGGSSTVVGANLDGTVAATSATQGDLTVSQGLAGQVDATTSTQGTVTVTAQLTGQVDAVSGTDAAVTSGAVPLAGQVDATSATEGTLGATVALTGQVDAVTDAQGTLGAPPLPGQLSAHSTTRITSAITTARDVDYISAASTTRITSSIVPSFELAIDPVTGRPQYRLIVVDSHGTPLGELQNAAIGDPVQKLGQPGTFTATLPSRDPKATLLDVGAQVQVWAGARMLPGAWFVLVQPGKDGGGQISYEFVGLEGLLDNVVIGTERPELLRNGGFEEGLRYWHPTWLQGSAAQAPPKTTIVSGALAKEGGKALQVEAVESVNVREVKTAAIFYGNRPSASEPLAAGFLPGGEKLITDQLPAFSQGTALLVEGFTADVDSGDGLELSKRRALAAKAVIVKARPDLKVTAVGRGESIQVAPNNSEANSAKNRRILLTGTATRVGHRQIVQQFFTWTNTSRVPVELELDGWIDLIKYVGPSKDRYGLYINRRNGASLEPDALPTVDEDRDLLEQYAVAYAGMKPAKAQAYDTKEELYAAIVAATPSKAKIVQAEHTDLPEDFPHERWTPDGTSELAAPPDGRKYLYEVRLYGSAGKTLFDEISVKPNLRTGFYNVTRPQLFAGLVAEAQNVEHGKVDLNIETNCPAWGVRDDYEYEWKTPRTPWDAIEEQLRADDAPDFGIVTTQTRRIATTWANRGRRSPVHLRLGDIVTGYTAGVDGDKVATTAIATSNRSRGPGVAEARVRTGPVNGLVFERVQSAEPDRSRTRLRQMATAMTRYGRTDVLTSVTCDPAWTVKLLGQVGLGDRVWCVVHDGDTHVEGWYRIVEIRHSISKHQLSYELTPEV